MKIQFWYHIQLPHKTIFLTYQYLYPLENWQPDTESRWDLALRNWWCFAVIQRWFTMDHASWCAGPYEVPTHTESRLTCCNSFDWQNVARGLRFWLEGVLLMHNELLYTYRLKITPIFYVSRGLVWVDSSCSGSHGVESSGAPVSCSSACWLLAEPSTLWPQDWSPCARYCPKWYVHVSSFGPHNSSKKWEVAQPHLQLRKQNTEMLDHLFSATQPGSDGSHLLPVCMIWLWESRISGF